MTFGSRMKLESHLGWVFSVEGVSEIGSPAELVGTQGANEGGTHRSYHHPHSLYRIENPVAVIKRRATR